jgi:hypothetical protein
VLEEVPARPGEEALYGCFEQVLNAAGRDQYVADALTAAAVDANDGLVQDLFEFRNIGIPVAHHWSTQKNGAAFGTDYLSRTSMGKANIFVNTPIETTYFYQDLDVDGQRLNGDGIYTVTFDATALPPVRGFWSLTLYNQHHFFHPNPLDRYSLGTKNKHLTTSADGSLTMHVSSKPPTGAGEEANWLPAPEAEFSLYLRAYWPEQQILDGRWTPPPVQRTTAGASGRDSGR